jgi:hypothetical protein
MAKNISLFLDCGAPSLYNKLSRIRKEKGVMGSHMKDRKRDDFSYIETEEYLQYRDSYIEFVKKNKGVLDVYSNLDVINNPKATWENQRYLEGKGIKPIPVFHLGSDPSWLVKYIEAKYDYIAIGGMVPNAPSVLIPLLDDFWSKYLTDEKGMPVVKIHGFAMTSLPLMFRYPWYSVDSTSWVMTSRFGSVYVPRFRNGKWIYDENSWKISLSSRSPSKEDAGQHLDSVSPFVQEEIVRYFKEKGYRIGKSEFRMEIESYSLKDNERWNGKEVIDGKREIELVLEEGLCNSYRLRDEINIIYFLDVEKSMPKWPWPFKKQRKGFGL